MLFSHQQKFSSNEIELIEKVLEHLLGRDAEYCLEVIQSNGFIFLDRWDKKMGFVKEAKDRYIILSLYFKESNCSFYQVIIKGASEKWVDSRIFDSNMVREIGIVSK